MPLIVAIFSALSVTPSVSLPEDTIPQLVQTHVSLDVQVNYDAGTVAGSARLVLRNTGSDPIPVVPLQVGRLMTVTAVHSEDGQPISYSQDVIQFSDWPRLQVNQIHVALGEDLLPGEELVLTVTYGGILVGYTESGMSYVRDRVDRKFTILRTDAFAFPSVGVQSISGLRSLPREDFSFAAKITVPTGLTVAAAVSPTAIEDADDVTTWTFRGGDPVPFLNIAIASYDTLNAPGVRIYYFPDDREGAARLSERVQQTMDSYGVWFSTPRPDGQTTIIEIPEGWGSQASLAGGIIQTADAFRDLGEMSQLYHEIAHLWHPPEMDLPSIRWSEGLATFLAMRMEADIEPAVDLRTSAEALAERQRGRQAGNPIPMVEFGERDLTDLSYGTGALMFYVLYESLGVDVADQALGAYIRQYRETGSSTAEFVESMMIANPHVVGAVLDEWLYTTTWLERLEAGETLAELIESYRASLGLQHRRRGGAPGCLASSNACSGTPGAFACSHGDGRAHSAVTRTPRNISPDFDSASHDRDKSEIERPEIGALGRSTYAPHPPPGPTFGHARDAGRARSTAGLPSMLGEMFGRLGPRIPEVRHGA